MRLAVRFLVFLHELEAFFALIILPEEHILRTVPEAVIM